MIGSAAHFAWDSAMATHRRGIVNVLEFAHNEHGLKQTRR
jgi:hypothetical protein